MTNFIFSAAFAVVVALASVMGSLSPAQPNGMLAKARTLSNREGDRFTQEGICNVESGSQYHLSEEEQIALYEQVMDECVLNEDVIEEHVIAKKDCEYVTE